MKKATSTSFASCTCSSTRIRKTMLSTRRLLCRVEIFHFCAPGFSSKQPRFITSFVWCWSSSSWLAPKVHPITVTRLQTTINNWRKLELWFYLRKKKNNKKTRECIPVFYRTQLQNAFVVPRYLVRFVGDSSKKLSNATRILAMNCLFHIADDELIEQLTQQHADDLRFDATLCIQYVVLQHCIVQ